MRLAVLAIACLSFAVIADAADNPPLETTPLTDAQLQAVLGQRLDGGLGFTFDRFANRFLVTSRITIGKGVALVSTAKEIVGTQLQPVFPDFYQPTLRELLDAIALQTRSDWRYEPSGKFFKNNTGRPAQDPDLVTIEFQPRAAARPKPYRVALAAGWKSDDKGQWTMCVPPQFPVGLDIYEMGTYSAATPKDEAALMPRVADALALTWAKRVSEDAGPGKIATRKVGAYEARFFEAQVPSQLGKDLHWRHWVVPVGHRCFFLVSTLPDDLDPQVLRDVEAMLASFTVPETADAGDSAVAAPAAPPAATDSPP